MAKKVRVITEHAELCSKLNSLNFTNSVMIKRDKNIKINRVLNNINSKGKVLSAEHIGQYVVLSKLKPIEMNVYKKKKPIEWL